MLNRRTIMALACLLSVPATAQQTAPMPVVASFSILGDMIRQIGGTRVAVTDLIGPNEDAHGFQPSPAEARKLVATKVIFTIGLGFEPFMARLAKASGATAQSTVVSTGIVALGRLKSKTHGHDDAHGEYDPHIWQSVSNAKMMATNIANGLINADPAGKAEYERSLAAYLAKLDALDADIRATIAALPADRRSAAIAHDAFRYFSRDYGFAFNALQGISAENEPSAADMARIIRQLKQSKAPAVFLENVSDPRKVKQIASETSAKIGGTLYSDQLSLASGPAPTYIDMMRHNVREIAKALTP